MFLKTTKKTNMTNIYIYVKQCLQYLGVGVNKALLVFIILNIKTFNPSESSLLYFNGQLSY